MRAAPPLQVTVVRFGVWRAALGALIAAGIAASGAWLLADSDRPPALLATVGVSMLVALVVAASRLRVAPFHMRWNGARWHVSAPAWGDAIEDAPWSGRVDVSIDLGAWLLLEFVPESGPRRCPHRWLPLQRRGLEPQWHALRATVYSARPGVLVPGEVVNAARPDPAE